MLLLAEAVTQIDFSSVTPIVSAIGSLGFAIWFAYYTTTTTLPNQQKEHREAIKELSVNFTNALQESKTIHAGTIKELVGEMKSARDSYDRWKMSGGQISH